MTSDKFAAATRVEIPASFTTRAWVTDAPLEQVFSNPGSYELYVSEILESEVGGYICSFIYTGMNPN
jgi:hypothetical protein